MAKEKGDTKQDIDESMKRAGVDKKVKDAAELLKKLKQQTNHK
jgi:hypothetical protein